MDAFDRTRRLIGPDGMATLAAARVAVFGVGGVGSFAAEALIRAPIGHLLLLDRDRVTLTNLNRQLHATHATLGQAKVAVMAARAERIAPESHVDTARVTLTPDSVDAWLDQGWDAVVDAVDDVEVKVALLAACRRRAIPVVSSMGAAAKLDPGAVRVADLFETRHCPLARVLRKRLRKLGIDHGIQAVYSEEMPIRTAPGAQHEAPPSESTDTRRPQGTISYLPALFGLHCARTVVHHLLRDLPLLRLGDTPRCPRPGRTDGLPSPRGSRGSR